MPIIRKINSQNLEEITNLLNLFTESILEDENIGNLTITPAEWHTKSYDEIIKNTNMHHYFGIFNDKQIFGFVKIAPEFPLRERLKHNYIS